MRLHPVHRSPVIAVGIQFVIAVAVTLALGFAHNPVNAFVLIATIIVSVRLAVYIEVDAACIGFFARYRREDFNWLLHLLFFRYSRSSLSPQRFSRPKEFRCCPSSSN